MAKNWKGGWGNDKPAPKQTKVAPARMSVADGIRYRMLERQWAEEALLMVPMSGHPQK